MGLPLDDNLRRLFQEEADERLDRIEEGLERAARAAVTDDDQRMLVREAHTLKGAAAMAGLVDVEAASRTLEAAVRSLPSVPSADEVAALQASVDVLRSLITAALAR